MENEKSREDYQNECYRLTFQLKKARDKLKQLTDKNLSEKDKNILEEKNKTISSLNANLLYYKNKENSQKEEISVLKQQNAKYERIVNIDYKKLKIENKKLVAELKVFKDFFKTFTTRNKQVFGSYFNKLAENDKVRISMGTVILDLEYMFSFQKLFEMHVYDYIVDRQDPDNKTNQDNVNLIIACKDFTNIVFKSMAYQTTLNVPMFKRAFLNFIKDFYEPDFMHRNKREKDEW